MAFIAQYSVAIAIAGAVVLAWGLGAVLAALIASRTIGMARDHEYELARFYLRLAMTLPLLLAGISMNWFLRRLDGRPRAIRRPPRKIFGPLSGV